MAVVARFVGGPRNGRKNNLQGHNEAPERIAVTAKEAKAVNMKPGRYERGLQDDDCQSAVYHWRTIREVESA